MAGVGNGQLNEYWASRADDADILRPPFGGNCSVGSCIKWPGSLETAIGYGYCDNEQLAAIRYIHPKVIRRAGNWLVQDQHMCSSPAW